MFLFNVIHVLHNRSRVKSYLIQVDSRFEALIYIAARNRFQPYRNDLVEFLRDRYDAIVMAMSNDDPRLEQLEQQRGIACVGHIGLSEILSIGTQTGAITENHLTKFIFKPDSDDNVFTLNEVAIDDSNPL